MLRLFYYISLILTSIFSASGYESMHEKTPVGKIVVFYVPERTALESSTEKSYFSNDNGLFRKLFRFINSNNISMTTPVEADINPGKMRFFVGAKDLTKDFKSTNEVTVKKLPRIKVAAIGMRGGYTEKRFKENLRKLSDWVENNKNIQPSGKPYGVYWNGPFVPGLLKRSEIHLPIKNLPPKSKSKKLKSLK